MARDDDRRPPWAKAPRGDRPDDLCRHYASAGLCRGRPVCRSQGAARQIYLDRPYRNHRPGLGPHAVAGDRIGDAGVLCARRSRSHHVLAGPSQQRVFGSDRRDRAVGHCDGIVIVDAVRRRPRDRRRHQVVCGLRRRRRDRTVGRGGCDRGHDCAVSIDRPEPDPAGGANPRRDHRRRFCHCAADRRDPVLWHAVAVCGLDLGCRGRLCP